MQGYPGHQSDWTTILQMLKAEDEMLVYQGAMELRDALSYAQENQMHGFATEQYMDILVKIVTRDPLTDLSNEVKYFVVQCLTTLMDIFPSLVNALVHAGLPKGMVDLIRNSLGFLDLAEACIKGFEKIAMENPSAVLKSGALAAVIEQIDFFEIGVQLRIFKIIQKIARHSGSEADLDAHIQPILPYVCMNMGIDTARNDPKKVEDSSKIICEIQDSFCLFYSSILDFDKIAAQYDKMQACGVYDIILEHMRQYADIQNKLYSDTIIDPVIVSSPSNQTLSQQTMINFFKILESACYFSYKVANKLFGESNLLNDLCAFLPRDAKQTQQSGADDFRLILEAITLLQTMISDKENQQNENIKKSPEASKALKASEKMKRDFQLSEAQRHKLAAVAEQLLPRVLTVYETSINAQFRIRTLKLIDKIISLMDPDLLKSFLEPYQFATFVIQILRSRHSGSITASLDIARKVLDCSPMTHAVPFIREGVSELIRNLSSETNFKAHMGISQSTSITEKGFDLDIYEAKEALHQIRMNNPDDHATRDFFERKLLELVERQKQQQTIQNKDNKNDEINQQSQPKNTALKIIDTAQSLLKDYFDNNEFIDQLKMHSQQTSLQLGILEELQKLAQSLCEEACIVQMTAQNLQNARQILIRIGEIMTINNCTITSHEFKQSQLLWALNLFLTKTPSQAKIEVEKARHRETGEEMKRAEEMDLLEAQKQSKQVSKKEGRCMILRLQHFTHVFLKSLKPNGITPLQALIDLNQRIISENDSTFTSSGSNGPNGPSINRDHGFGGTFGGQPPQLGDYDHCINALRQLQKRVTVCLIYDPKKEHLQKSGKKPKQAQAKGDLPVPKDPLQEFYLGPQGEDDDDLVNPPDLDSQMEDQSEDKGAGELSPKALKQKGLSHLPALTHLAASPEKDKGPSAIMTQKVNSSKVYLKRHSLYSELGQIPVTVEQSTCLQVLEDFLRNKVKTADQVRGLKLDYGLGAFSGGPPGSSSMSSLFGGAFQGHYQSMSQKMLRKGLGEPARKILDSANERLSKILSGNMAVRIKAAKAKAEGGEGSGEEMEGIEAAQKDGSGDEGSHSDGYGDIEDEEEHEAAEMERERLLDVYVEELPDEILNSGIPEDQMQALAKALPRQHAFMLDHLRMRLEEAAEDQDWGLNEADRHEEMERIEERLEDFQETMERVQARFHDKFNEMKANKKPEASLDPKNTEELKKDEGNKEPVQQEGDQEMADESQPEEQEAQKKEETGDKELSSIKPGESEKKDDQKDTLKKEDEAKLKQPTLEMMITGDLAEQAMARDKLLHEKLRGIKQALKEKGAVEQQNEVSAQTQELLTQDLEELIQQQGEDIDFEFFYEGKQILSHQSMFEIVKINEAKIRQAERAAQGADQLRLLQAKEEELRRRARKLAENKNASGHEEEAALLKRERDRLKELLNQIYADIGGSLRPHGLLGGLNAHKIYFTIRDKCDEVAELQRQRIDSLAELTNSSLKPRNRTKSEAVKDISSGAINEFVAQLLDREFRVFDEEDEEETVDETSFLPKQTNSQPADEEMAEEANDKAKKEDKQIIDSVGSKPARVKDSRREEKDQLGQALKILKVINYLQGHQDLISDKGIRLVMKAGSTQEDDSNSINSGGKQASQEGCFSDLELQVGFATMHASAFHHHKLDSYLLRSIKDPYNLVQGGISSTMQQIFQNCPFLFPFSTKQLYFRLVSFISSIDVHRAIYFLRQHLKQSGSQKANQQEKDNLRKIAKQKATVQRDNLIPSAFALIQKIDKRSFLEFEFEREEGFGLGPTLEFYDNIAEEFRKWSVQAGEGRRHSMWRECPDQLLFPHPVCLETLPAETTKQIYEIFRLCGTIVAKAIVDDRQIDLPISPLFWRLCLGSQLSIFDMQKLDPAVFSTLAEFSIIANKAAEVEKQCEAKKLSDEVKQRQLQGLTLANGGRVEDYGLVFTLPAYDNIELIRGGSERAVELENVQDYVDLSLHYTFHETIKLQVQAFKKGFNAIFPISSLAPFTHAGSEEGELETIVCGIGCDGAEWRSKEELMQLIQPDHGYTRTSEQYLHFIRYITELEPAERPAFIKFLTGSKRLPLGGFKGLSPPLTLVLKRENAGQQPDEPLPSVMACQNYVKAPRYSSYDVFKIKFDHAVSEGQQNFTLS